MSILKLDKERDMAAVGVGRLDWRKSARSTSQANCVEVAFNGRFVMTRDSKRPANAVLVFPGAHWATFLDGVREGRFES